MEFVFTDHSTTADIAVLKLKHPLDFKKHKHLKALELPTRGVKHYIGKTGKIAGFGWTWVSNFTLTVSGSHGRFGGHNDTNLRYVVAHILNDRDCQFGYKYKKIDVSKLFCARVLHNDGRDSGVCTGDSGGPFVLDGKTVIGILSEASPTCTEVLRSGLYTRVASYLSFIENARKDKPRDDIRTHVFNI